jgi:hypothetical protein
MTRAPIGLALLSASIAFTRANAGTEVRCQPILLQRCENALKMRLEHGSVPNRCIVT